MNIVIRDATIDDAMVVADFNSRLAEETEGRPLAANKIGPGVAALLSDANRGRYWLAIVNDEIAGQIMVTYEWSDWRNGMLWWIQSVYVSRKFRRRGVFSALYKHVESLARADEHSCGLRLYVEKSNGRARDIYRTLGMVEPGYLVMEAIFSDVRNS